MDIRKIYEYALQREHEGKRLFPHNAARFSHAAAVGAFEQLAAEEQKHIDFIQALIDGLDEGASRPRHWACDLEAEGFFSSAPRPRCSTRP